MRSIGQRREGCQDTGPPPAARRPVGDRNTHLPQPPSRRIRHHRILDRQRRHQLAHGVRIPVPDRIPGRPRRIIPLCGDFCEPYIPGAHLLGGVPAYPYSRATTCALRPAHGSPPPRVTRSSSTTTRPSWPNRRVLGYGVPAGVKKAFRAHLHCGTLVQHPAHGRGRRHLTDHVLPRLPVRQWVLSLPEHLCPSRHHNPDIGPSRVPDSDAAGEPRHPDGRAALGVAAGLCRRGRSPGGSRSASGGAPVLRRVGGPVSIRRARR